jgi:hypothetical protein
MGVMRGCMLFILAATGAASAQQLAFTSRDYLRSPVGIVSVQSSQDFGFDSVILSNHSSDAVRAVRFQIVWRTNAGDEVIEERREVVNLESQESKRFGIGMARTETLRRMAKLRGLQEALAIVAVESVEFENGSEWKQTERDGGVIMDTSQAEIPRKK